MARLMARTAAFSALLLSANAQGQEPLPLWLNPDKQAHVANCVVNIGIASTFLGKAGVGINAAILNCPHQDTVDNTAVCTATVAGIVASLAYGAGFIAASAAECRSSLALVDENKVLQEGCAASTAVIIATLGLMTNAGATIKDTCPGVRYQDPTFVEDEGLGTDARRLQGSRLDPAERRRLTELGSNKTAVWEKLEEARRKLIKGGIPVPTNKTGGKRLAKDAKNLMQGGAASAERAGPKVTPTEGDEAEVHSRTALQNAACAFDVSQFTFLAARSGLMINYAVKDCSVHVLNEGNRAIHEAKCIADVGRTIGAFGYTASGIAFTVFECPDIIDNVDAACAGSIVNLVAGTAELVANGADAWASCSEMNKPVAVEDVDEQDVADVVRRLSPDQTMTNWV